MERITRTCEEVHAFAGTAERTGKIAKLCGLKTGKTTCTSLRDLVRKYHLYGDGFYYVPADQWPGDQQSIDLDNVKWQGASRTRVSEREKRLTRPEARARREQERPEAEE
jgi:hypothetical protein